jgi:integral membrane protein
MTTPTTPVTAPVTPERQRRVKGALTRYSVLAYITGLFLLFLCVEMILKYLVFPPMDIDAPGWFSLVAIVHGWIFLIYCATCLDLGVKARWAPAKWVTTILAGVIPVLSFVLERRRRNEVIEAFGLAG